MPARTRPPSAGGIPAKDLIVLAFLNTRRHGLRAMANIAGIAVSVAALVFFLSFFRGTYEGVMFSSVIDYGSSHGQFSAAGFDDDDPDSWLDGANLLDRASITEAGLFADAYRDAARGAWVPALSPRLMAPAFAGDGSRAAAVTLAGVDFPAEARTLSIGNKLTAGAFGPDGVVIGSSLARVLSLKVGDELRVRAVAADGAANLDYWKVSGIFNTAYPPLDRGLVLMDLPQAQEFLATGDRVNKVYARLAPGGDSRARERALAAMDSGDQRELLDARGLAFRDWTLYAASIVEDARKDSIFYGVFIGILLFLSLSTMAGTMRVTVFERRREIGMLRATGWLRGELGWLFLCETLLIGLAGSLLGCAAGGLASLALEANPVLYGNALPGLDIPAFSFTCDPRFGDLGLAFAAGLATALLAGLSPARSAARMPILAALSER